MIRQFLSSGLEMYQEGQGGKKIVIGKSRFRQPAHPWEVIDMGWYKGDFGAQGKDGAWCVVMNPGFVNGIDPIIKGSVGFNQGALNNAKAVAIASNRAGLGGANKEVYATDARLPFKIDTTNRENRPLLQGPLLALDFNRGRTYPGDKVTPMKIQNLGVPAKDEGANISVVGDMLVTDVTNENKKQTKKSIAKAIDIVLAMAKPTLEEKTLFSGDAGIVSGRLVEYQWGYNTTTINALGWRPFIYQIQDYDTDLISRKEQTQMDIMTNQPAADDGLDKLHLARAWAVSPPDPESDQVDGTWNIFIEYRCFWNLCYTLRIPRIYPSYPPIRYFSGLAFGLGDAIINSYLALQDEILQRVYNGVVNANAPKGVFWNI